MKTILVTGGTGLVGYSLNSIKDKYNYNFVFLSSKDCDLTNYCKTYKLFNKIKPDYVIHLAANVGGLYKNIKMKKEIFEDNLSINLNILKCCNIFNVERLLSCLSTCIFPDEIDYPISEKDLHKGPPHNSNYAYSYSKRMLHIHTKLYREQFNKKYSCVIPTNIYGPNDNFNLQDSHVIPGLINKCYLAKKNNTSLIVSGSGKPRRQFLFSKDLASLIMFIILETNNNDDYIISPSEEEEVSIKLLSNYISNNFNCKIIYDLSKSDGQFKKTCSNKKIQELYKNKYGKYYNFIKLKDGLKITIDWFKHNLDSIRN